MQLKIENVEAERAIEKYINGRIAEIQSELCKDKTDVETWKLRGKASELRSMMAKLKGKHDNNGI